MPAPKLTEEDAREIAEAYEAIAKPMLRDLFAAAAWCAILANKNAFTGGLNSPEAFAQGAFNAADAMMLERERRAR